MRIFGKLMASLSNAVHDIKEAIAITHSVTHSLALYKKYKGTIGYDSESLMWPFGINGCDRRRLRDSNGGGDRLTVKNPWGCVLVHCSHHNSSTTTYFQHSYNLQLKCTRNGLAAGFRPHPLVGVTALLQTFSWSYEMELPGKGRQNKERG